MKQIENVSISGISFKLDTEGYNTLKDYLARLGKAYGNNPDAAEIIADIEARVAEIILSKQAPDSVVPAELVREIIARLGLPEDDPAAASGDNGPGMASGPERTFPRRLYRDPQSGKIGGVCSGIANFLDIDPVWVRLAVFAPLILLILSAPLGWDELSSMLGVMIAAVALVYFLLWFTVPAARTPRQRLEMRGERITASTIEHSFRRAAPGDERSQRSAAVWAAVVWVLGRIILISIKVVVMIVAVALLVAAMAILFAVGAVLLVPHVRFPNGQLLSDFAGLWGISPEGYAALTLLVAFIPIVTLAVLLIGLVFDRRVRGRFLSILGLAGLLLVILWGVITIRNSRTLIDGFDGFHRFEFSHWEEHDSDRGHATVNIDDHMKVDTLPPVTVEVIE